MQQRIKLNKKQRECLEPLIERREIARAAFSHASRMIHDAEKAFWEKTVELWPNAKHVEHPPKGGWTITVCEADEEEKE